MIVDIVDKYCTNDNNPIKNLRLIPPITNWVLLRPPVLGTLVINNDNNKQGNLLNDKLEPKKYRMRESGGGGGDRAPIGNVQ